MTKADIVNTIADATGISKVDTEAVVNAFLVSVGDALQDNQTIEIRGFGTFLVREKQPRTARNPRTGETVQVPRKFVPAFKPSRDFKESVNQAIQK